MNSKDYDIDFKNKTIEVFNIKGVGELITSLQFLLKEWKEYKIIIHTNEGKTNL